MGATNSNFANLSLGDLLVGPFWHKYHFYSLKLSFRGSARDSLSLHSEQEWDCGRCMFLGLMFCKFFLLDGHLASQPGDGILRIEVPIAGHDKDNAS